MRIIGIDPGADGGFAILQDGTLRAHGSMSIHPDATDWEVLESNGLFDVLCFERTTALPAFWKVHGRKVHAGGSKANWLRGHSAGLLLGWARGAKILRIMHPSAHAWQKVMLDGIPGDNTKKRSIVSARDFYPDATLITKGGRILDGVADAINIATYAHRIIQSERS